MLFAQDSVWSDPTILDGLSGETAAGSLEENLVLPQKSRGWTLGLTFGPGMTMNRSSYDCNSNSCRQQKTRRFSQKKEEDGWLVGWFGSAGWPVPHKKEQMDC